MFDNLPSTAVDYRTWPWEEIKPYYDDLLARDLSADTLDQWMADWSKLSALAFDAEHGLRIASNRNTADQEAADQRARFNADIRPHIEIAVMAVRKKLVDSGLQPEQFDIQLRNMQSDIDIFREENLPIEGELKNLDTEYDAVRGAQTVEWDGEEVTLYQLQPVYHETDRERRKAAWMLGAERRLEDREAINELWRQYFTRREQIAANAGFDTYRDYMWRDLKRFDYTPEDAFTFYDAIEQTFVPAAKRLYEKRRQQMGLDSLRPWDTSVDPQGRPALKPYETIDELIRVTRDILAKVDPGFGQMFQRMQDEDKLDLENRSNKAPGGYCNPNLTEKTSFIFMNAVGVHTDVRVMLHEAGHAAHNHLAGRLPYAMQIDFDAVPSETAEVASMAMELLGAPYLLKSEGGFYDEADYVRGRIDHLEGILLFPPYMAVIDRIQQWAYTHPEQGRDPDQLDEKFAELWDRYMIGIDYSGLDDIKRSRWQWQIHPFRYPFYYIEYGLAQMGALQVWRNALDDQERAVQQYRDALALGGTCTIPEFFETAGAKFVFDADTLGELVELIETEMAKLEAMA